MTKQAIWGDRLCLVLALAMLGGCEVGDVLLGGGESETGAEEGTTMAGDGDGDGDGLDADVEIAEAINDLEFIVNATVAYYEAENGNPDIEGLHKCPHPEGSPVGGEASITPDIGLSCNDGPGQMCVPVEGAPDPGTYEPFLWSLNNVWNALPFAKDEPHPFHYNLIAINEDTGYGDCVFTAQAFADLDEDFVFSTYERSGTLNEEGVTLNPLFIDLGYE